MKALVKGLTWNEFECQSSINQLSDNYQLIMSEHIAIPGN